MASLQYRLFGRVRQRAMPCQRHRSGGFAHPAACSGLRSVGAGAALSGSACSLSQRAGPTSAGRATMRPIPGFRIPAMTKTCLPAWLVLDDVSFAYGRGPVV